MTTREILTHARDLINDETKWTRNCEAINSHGKESPINAEESVAWCAVGALKCVSDEEIYDTLTQDYDITPKVKTIVNLMATLITKSPYESELDLERTYSIDVSIVSDFNDANTHAEVIELFDETIKNFQ